MSGPPGKSLRPTKKQQELLLFIQQFVDEHGYGPSYREIQSGCNYSSVATVAKHVHNLIARGLLAKQGRSARSLEIVQSASSSQTSPSPIGTNWLLDEIEKHFSALKPNFDHLYVLVGALKVLGLEDNHLDYLAKLQDLEQLPALPQNNLT